ncbi:MAG: glycosyltransferase [Minisyncoccia bacterium]
MKNSKKKVLEIITKSDWAGAQKIVYDICDGMKTHYENEIDIEVATGSEGPLIDKLKSLNVKVYILSNLVREINPIKDLRAYFEIKKIIKRGNFDVVHCHSTKAGILGRIAAKRCGVKNIIYTVHGWWAITQYTGIKRKLAIYAEKFASKYCDKIVFLCKKESEKAKKWKIGKENQYLVIPNSIPLLDKPSKGILRRELNLDDQVKIVGNVGRLDPPKNPIRFLKVADLVLQIRKDTIFVWIGDSNNDFYKEEIDSFFEIHRDLKSKIIFLGFRSNAPELMSDFDIFLLTSDDEGMPLVILEAFSLGIPVVSTEVGCLREMSEYGNIKLVDISDKESEKQLADKVLVLLNLNTKNSEVNFHQRNMIEDYFKIYTSER